MKYKTLKKRNYGGMKKSDFTFEYEPNTAENSYESQQKLYDFKNKYNSLLNLMIEDTNFLNANSQIVTNADVLNGLRGVEKIESEEDIDKQRRLLLKSIIYTFAKNKDLSLKDRLALEKYSFEVIKPSFDMNDYLPFLNRINWFHINNQLEEAVNPIIETFKNYHKLSYSKKEINDAAVFLRNQLFDQKQDIKHYLMLKKYIDFHPELNSKFLALVDLRSVINALYKRVLEDIKIEEIVEKIEKSNKESEKLESEEDQLISKMEKINIAPIEDAEIINIVNFAMNKYGIVLETNSYRLKVFYEFMKNLFKFYINPNNGVINESVKPSINEISLIIYKIIANTISSEEPRDRLELITNNYLFLALMYDMFVSYEFEENTFEDILNRLLPKIPKITKENASQIKKLIEDRKLLIKELSNDAANAYALFNSLSVFGYDPTIPDSMIILVQMFRNYVSTSYCKLMLRFINESGENNRIFDLKLSNEDLDILQKKTYNEIGKLYFVSNDLYKILDSIVNPSIVGNTGFTYYYFISSIALNLVLKFNNNDEIYKRIDPNMLVTFMITGRIYYDNFLSIIQVHKDVTNPELNSKIFVFTKEIFAEIPYTYLFIVCAYFKDDGIPIIEIFVSASLNKDSYDYNQETIIQALTILNQKYENEIIERLSVTLGFIESIYRPNSEFSLKLNSIIEESGGKVKSIETLVISAPSKQQERISLIRKKMEKRKESKELPKTISKVDEEISLKQAAAIIEQEEKEKAAKLAKQTKKIEEKVKKQAEMEKQALMAKEKERENQIKMQRSEKLNDILLYTKNLNKFIDTIKVFETNIDKNLDKLEKMKVGLTPIFSFDNQIEKSFNYIKEFISTGKNLQTQIDSEIENLKFIDDLSEIELRFSEIKELISKYEINVKNAEKLENYLIVDLIPSYINNLENQKLELMAKMFINELDWSFWSAIFANEIDLYNFIINIRNYLIEDNNVKLFIKNNIPAHKIPLTIIDYELDRLIIIAGVLTKKMKEVGSIIIKGKIAVQIDIPANSNIIGSELLITDDLDLLVLNDNEERSRIMAEQIGKIMVLICKEMHPTLESSLITTQKAEGTYSNVKVTSMKISGKTKVVDISFSDPGNYIRNLYKSNALITPFLLGKELDGEFLTPNIEALLEEALVNVINYYKLMNEKDDKNSKIYRFNAYKFRITANVILQVLSNSTKINELLLRNKLKKVFENIEYSDLEIDEIMHFLLNEPTRIRKGGTRKKRRIENKLTKRI